MRGAETCLLAGFVRDVMFEDTVTGLYVIPEGRWHSGRLWRVELEGGGTFEWCEEMVQEFVS